MVVISASTLIYINLGITNKCYPSYLSPDFWSGLLVMMTELKKTLQGWLYTVLSTRLQFILNFVPLPLFFYLILPFLWNIHKMVCQRGHKYLSKKYSLCQMAGFWLQISKFSLNESKSWICGWQGGVRNCWCLFLSSATEISFGDVCLNPKSKGQYTHW